MPPWESPGRQRREEEDDTADMWGRTAVRERGKGWRGLVAQAGHWAEGEEARPSGQKADGEIFLFLLFLFSSFLFLFYFKAISKTNLKIILKSV